MGVRSSFDMVVIGTGEAGAAVATECRAAGWQVAIVDSRDFGGTCGLRGYGPKKVLSGAAEVVDRRRRMEDRGLCGDMRIDWPALMRFKRTFTDPFLQAREGASPRPGSRPSTELRASPVGRRCRWAMVFSTPGNMRWMLT